MSKGFLAKLAERFKGGASSSDVELERRRAKREEISIPVRLRAGHRRIDNARARNLSPIGLFVETDTIPPRGSTITLVFNGVGEGSGDIEVIGEVVWTSIPPDEGIGIQINRQKTDEDALKGFRAMVLHYIRHPPLLDGGGSGKYREVKCNNCSWIGRVGAGNPMCPSCGSLDLGQL